MVVLVIILFLLLCSDIREENNRLQSSIESHLREIEQTIKEIERQKFF